MDVTGKIRENRLKQRGEITDEIVKKISNKIEVERNRERSKRPKEKQDGGFCRRYESIVDE